jgi:septal ring factor EnvC (AmiA/AmiB activator)
MSEGPREIEIEALKTPKGNVPTIKGLETAITTVYKEIASLVRHLSLINESLTKIDTQLKEQNNKIGGVGESIAKLIVHLGKLEAQEEHKRNISRKKLLIDKADLMALKEDLTRILDQLENRVIENES